MSAGSAKSIRLAIVISALGYFIDVFDIQLFPVLRVPSLTELGVSPDQLATVGGYILNIQMLGMILGAFLWGRLGDKFGRIKALYGSILLYSIGTLACSFVRDPITYGLLRFVTGFGLAGEVGAAVTLVGELMPAQKRGWGITLIGAFGFLGPAAAVLCSYFLGWRMAYIVAGLLGLALFVVRVKLSESVLFQKINREKCAPGSLKFLMQSKQGMFFLCCILMGFPFGYLWNFLNFFSAELSSAVLNAGEVFNQKFCLFMFYVGTSCGDVIAGCASQLLRSRRKAVAGIYMLGIVATAGYLSLAPMFKISANILYGLYFVIGVAGGGWILLNTIAAEHFGTNIRATASIVIINFVRGLAILMVLASQILRHYMVLPNAGLVIGIVIYIGGFWALSRLHETHGLDLDYVEALENRK